MALNELLYILSYRVSIMLLFYRPWKQFTPTPLLTRICFIQILLCQWFMPFFASLHTYLRVNLCCWVDHSSSTYRNFPLYIFWRLANNTFETLMKILLDKIATLERISTHCLLHSAKVHIVFQHYRKKDLNLNTYSS